jgi:hypothetical protein
MTPRLAMVDIMRQLRREGRTGYRMIGYRQIGISGAAVTEWVDFHPIVLDDETDA